MTAKDMISIMFNLTVLYLVGGLILAGVYAKTSPIMYQNELREKQEALKEVMPQADDMVKLGEWAPHHKHAEYFEGMRGEEKLGYVVQGFGKGYSSYINLFVAVDKDFVVRNVKILHHAETPGLGDEIMNESFTDQFKGKTLDHLVVVKRETDKDIQAITGATISSRAVTEGVREGVRMIVEKMSGEVKE